MVEHKAIDAWTNWRRATGEWADANRRLELAWERHALEHAGISLTLVAEVARLRAEADQLLSRVVQSLGPQ